MLFSQGLYNYNVEDWHPDCPERMHQHFDGKAFFILDMIRGSYYNSYLCHTSSGSIKLLYQLFNFYYASYTSPEIVIFT